MTPAHVIYIPCVLLAGIVVGWLIGVRAARAEAARRKATRADENDDL
jgi:hypothetical protein